MLDDEDLALLDVFIAWRGGGMGGHGPLPFSGGYAEQPAVVMDVLRHMSSCASKLEKKK